MAQIATKCFHSYCGIITANFSNSNVHNFVSLSPDILLITSLHVHQLFQMQYGTDGLAHGSVNTPVLQLIKKKRWFNFRPNQQWIAFILGHCKKWLIPEASKCVTYRWITGCLWPRLFSVRPRGGAWQKLLPLPTAIWCMLKLALFLLIQTKSALQLHSGFVVQQNSSAVVNRMSKTFILEVPLKGNSGNVNKICIKFLMSR